MVRTLAGLFTLLAAWPHGVRAEAALEEVTVTAQRVTERLQDVPVAVTAITGADLLNRGVRQAGEITSTVPHLLLNSPYGPEAQPTFTLRGVTAQDSSVRTRAALSPCTSMRSTRASARCRRCRCMTSIALRYCGDPQGTLYGKSDWRAISFYSKNPSLTATDGYVTAGLGELQCLLVAGRGRRSDRR
jgi:iron complex outermembrane receptor protein